jgi:hypothetical protein
MKNLKLSALLVVCSFLLSTTINASSFPNNSHKKYEIKVAGDMDYEKAVEKAWTLTYNAGDKPIMVVKHPTGNGATYSVHSDFFEVCYGCSSRGFGTRRVKNSWSRVDPYLCDVVINKDQLKNQEIITPKKKVDDDKALELIANYLPELINEEYKHLLN